MAWKKSMVSKKRTSTEIVKKSKGWNEYIKWVPAKLIAEA